MKRRIYKKYRAKKRGGQHYWVIKSTKRNYAGGPLFGRYLQEKGIAIEGTPKEQKTIRRLFERSPEIIQGIPKETKIKFGDVEGGLYYTPTSTITMERGITGKGARFLPEEVLRHEVEHTKTHPTNPKMFDITSSLFTAAEKGDKEAKQIIDNPSLYRKFITTNLAKRVETEEQLARTAQKAIPERKIKPSEEEEAKNLQEVKNERV